MTTPHHNDNLSPHFDGEAPPAERAESERLLQNSPDARAERYGWADDDRKIAALLNDLPREPAPPSFAENVLQTINTPDHQPPASSGSRTRRSLAHSRSTWWLIAGPLTLAAAAALLLMINSFNATHNQTPALELADNRFDDTPATGRATPPRAAESQPEALLRREAPPEPERAKALPAAPADFAETAEADASPLRFKDLQQLKDADVGEIITAFQQTPDGLGGGVAVVKLTVVDRQAGLSALQLLLARHEIPPDAEEEGQNSRRFNQSDETTAPPEEQLLAVYVESTTDHLTAALNELKNSNQFQQLALDSTRLTSIADAGAAGSGAADKLEAPSQTTEEQPAAGAAAPAAKAFAAKKLKPLSRQQQLALSPELFSKPPAQSARAPGEKIPDRWGGVRRRMLPEPSSTAPLKVLFVLVEPHPPEPHTPQPPANSKPPDTPPDPPPNNGAA